MKNVNNRSWLTLTPAMLHIALALADGELHGYGIMRVIGRLSGGQFEIGSGTLYRSLQKMHVDGMVSERLEKGTEGEEPKRLFRLTELGAKVAVAETLRLENLVSVARASSLFVRRSRRTHIKGERPNEKKS